MQRFVLALTILGSLSCLSGAQEAEKSPAPVNFEEHVFPIFRQHCLQCHNANDAEAGLALDSFGALMEGSGSGDVVAEGDSGSSRLYLVMTHDEEPAMPPDQDPIPAEQLDIIKRWIDGGLLENSGSKAKNEKVHHCRFLCRTAASQTRSSCRTKSGEFQLSRHNAPLPRQRLLRVLGLH